MSETLLTADGLERLADELAELYVRRADVATQLRNAYAAGGKLADNAEYHAAAEEQALLERRIAFLEQRYREAEVVEPAPDHAVGVGEPVRVRDLDTGEVLRLRIVGVGEADPAHGRVSYKSPVGSALLGRHAGETVELQAPSGLRRLKVLTAH